MTSQDKEQLIMAILATAELLGHEIKPATALVMADDLAPYGLQPALKALERCRRELSTRLTLSAVVERLEAADGRPTANEAWAMCLRSYDESATVALSDEISLAAEAASPVMQLGDKVGARMAFVAAYERIVRDAREQGRAPSWYISLGWDIRAREAPLLAAVDSGLISYDMAAPHLEACKPQESGAIAGLLTGKKPQVDSEVVRMHLDAIRKELDAVESYADRKARERAESEARKADVIARAADAIVGGVAYD